MVLLRRLIELKQKEILLLFLVKKIIVNRNEKKLYVNIKFDFYFEALFPMYKTQKITFGNLY